MCVLAYACVCMCVCLFVFVNVYLCVLVHILDTYGNVCGRKCKCVSCGVVSLCVCVAWTSMYADMFWYVGLYTLQTSGPGLRTESFKLLVKSNKKQRNAGANIHDYVNEGRFMNLSDRLLHMEATMKIIRHHSDKDKRDGRMTKKEFFRAETAAAFQVMMSVNGRRQVIYLYFYLYLLP